MEIQAAELWEQEQQPRGDPHRRIIVILFFEKSTSSGLVESSKEEMPNLRLADSFETRYDIYSTEE
eukprot:scaffold4448_cov149-Skeletonema_dohrnii-CCMP3373.AAC.5